MTTLTQWMFDYKPIRTNVRSDKCPFIIRLAVRTNVRSDKRPFGQMSGHLTYHEGVLVLVGIISVNYPRIDLLAARVISFKVGFPSLCEREMYC